MMKRSLLTMASAALIAMLASACATLIPKHDYTLIFTSHGQHFIENLVARYSGKVMSVGGVGDGISGVTEYELDWPDTITLSWRVVDDNPPLTPKGVMYRDPPGRDFTRTFKAPPPPPRSAGDWNLVVAFFDDDVMLEAMTDPTRWDPVVKRAPFYYGPAIDKRIKAEQQIKIEKARSAGEKTPKFHYIPLE